jgi:hypothetical protein
MRLHRGREQTHLLLLRGMLSRLRSLLLLLMVLLMLLLVLLLPHCLKVLQLLCSDVAFIGNLRVELRLQLLRSHLQ